MSEKLKQEQNKIQVRCEICENANDLLKDAAWRYGRQVGIKCTKQDFIVKLLNDAAGREYAEQAAEGGRDE